MFQFVMPTQQPVLWVNTAFSPNIPETGGVMYREAGNFKLYLCQNI
jgi:hypothetical protein